MQRSGIRPRRGRAGPPLLAATTQHPQPTRHGRTRKRRRASFVHLCAASPSPRDPTAHRQALRRKGTEIVLFWFLAYPRMLLARPDSWPPFRRTSKISPCGTSCRCPSAHQAQVETASYQACTYGTSEGGTSRKFSSHLRTRWECALCLRGAISTSGSTVVVDAPACCPYRARSCPLSGSTDSLTGSSSSCQGGGPSAGVPPVYGCLRVSSTTLAVARRRTGIKPIVNICCQSLCGRSSGWAFICL